MIGGGAVRVAIYSPDRARYYDGRTRERDGVGGGITARLSMGEALAALGHDVTSYVHCEAALTHRGVRYVPVDETDRIDCDVLVAISTVGSPTFAPIRRLAVSAGLRLIWVQGAPQIEDWQAVQADHVYVASNFLRTICVNRWRVPAKQTFVCYNGIHPEYFAGDSPARDPYAIAYVGPPEKGLAACVEVLRRLRRVDPRFHLDVFGGAELWGQTTPAFDEPGLRFMGILGQAKLAGALRGYEYCLALQTMAEGFGIAVQEAKRAGAIVIASAVGALPELIRHGADGYLIREPHSSAAAHASAASLVAALADDPGRRTRIRRRAEATPWNWNLAARTWTTHWSLAWTAKTTNTGITEIVDLPDGRHRSSDGAYMPGADVYPLSPVEERLGIPEPRTVVVGGYYGHQNLGDEALLAGLLGELQAAAPDVLPVVLSGDPARTAAAHDVIAIDEQNIAAVSDAVSKSDAVLLGGGGLLHDHHGIDEATLLRNGHWGLSLCAALPVLAAVHDKPFAVAGVGAGPLSSEASRRHARVIAERACAVTVRDDASRALLETLSPRLPPTRVTADLAFLLSSAPRETATRLIDRLNLPGRGPLVAVALRDWNVETAGASRKSEIAAALDNLITAVDARIIFVTFQASAGNVDDSDTAVGRSIQRLMRRGNRTALAPADLTPPVMQALLSECHLVVAMRLHAVILAANVGTPVVAISYTDKVSEAARQLGVEHYELELSRLTAESLTGLATAALAAAEQIRPELAARSDALRTAAHGTVEWIFGQIQERGQESPAPTPEWIAMLERGRAALASSASSPRSSPGGVVRKIARALIPIRWRRHLREAAGSRLMSPAATVFDRYKRRRIALYGTDLRGLSAPCEQGLVSIVLPAWNGSALIRESIDSILAQTHTRFELIVVNDGSTDDTGAIADEYARLDPRISVIHQDNRKLPAALSRGFEIARGEFLTWTSCDNRWKPDGIARLVDYLIRHPDVDLTYGNLDVIGGDGRPLRNSPHYVSYQHPHGSEHIRLPSSPLELNTRPNNFVGAGFLYRQRVACLLGDYDRSQFVVEDYDYWMRVNALMTVRHVDAVEPVVEYRFHGASLTARWDELGMFEVRDRLMEFDAVRRDRYLGPMVWRIEGSRAFCSSLADRVRRAGHALAFRAGETPGLSAAFAPEVYVRELAGSEPPAVPPDDLVQDATTILVATDAIPPGEIDPAWHCGIALGALSPRLLTRPHAGWLVASGIDALFQAIDIIAKTAQVNAIRELSRAKAPSPLVASVVVCTNREVLQLLPTLEAIAGQDVPGGAFEMIVVDNADRGDEAFREITNRWPGRLKVVSCAMPGLSAARNAGLGVARGQYVCYLDDDAVPASSWLGRICAAFDAHPEAAVIGGPALLRPPTPAPSVLGSGWETYWGHFPVDGDSYREARSWRDYPWGVNWAARRHDLLEIGGFPLSFGRRPGDFGGGEEHIAAARLARRGRRVGIAGDAVVYHHVAADRFTEAHVRETMTARYLTAWRAAQELGETNHLAILRTALRVALHHIDPRVKPLHLFWKDAAFRKTAQMRLLSAQWRDLRESFRRPLDEAPVRK